MLGTPRATAPDPDHPYVLVARELAPADTLALRRDLLLGIVLAESSPTSHTAIVARSLGIPTVVACSGALDVPEGTVVRLDGRTGALDTTPGDGDQGTPRTSRARRPRLVWPGRTADGIRVALLANVGTEADAERAVEAGAEGIGLLRTELLFLPRETEPQVEEQAAAYARLAGYFPEAPVVIRTLDAGADKQPRYLSPSGEPNPALGQRGLRMVHALGPDLLDRQLAAVALAATVTTARLRVMAPMVSVGQEAAWFADRARAHGIDSIGVMVEVPAAAVAAEEVLRPVDFASVGTNDLGQYAFAADRGCGPLTHLNDPWQPALLRLVRLAAEAGAALGRPVGVCGEAAADPLLAAVLVGLGVVSLSMVPTALADVGERLARVTLVQCRQAAGAACGAGDPRTARRAATEALRG